MPHAADRRRLSTGHAINGFNSLRLRSGIPVLRRALERRMVRLQAPVFLGIPVTLRIRKGACVMEEKSGETKIKMQPVLAFEHPFKVEVYESEFELLSSIRFLDQKTLATGKHTLEIGSVAGGCCKKLAFAIIETSYP